MKTRPHYMNCLIERNWNNSLLADILSDVSDWCACPRPQPSPHTRTNPHPTHPICLLLALWNIHSFSVRLCYSYGLLRHSICNASKQVLASVFGSVDAGVTETLPYYFHRVRKTLLLPLFGISRVLTCGAHYISSFNTLSFNLHFVSTITVPKGFRVVHVLYWDSPYWLWEYELKITEEYG